MKQAFIFILVVLISFACSNSKDNNDSSESETLTFTNAADYNMAIVKEQSKILICFDELDEAINEYIPDEMDAAYKKAEKTIESSIEKLNKMGGFDGNNEYKEAALDFFNTFKSTLYSEYKELIKYYKLSDEEFTEVISVKVDSIDNTLLSKQDSSFKSFLKIQLKFGREYDIIRDKND